MVAEDDIDSWPDTSAVMGCSVRGEKNVDTGTPCQDGNEKRTLSDGRYVIAGADGLGSASLSHVGSDTATQAVADFVEHKLGKIQSLDAETIESVLEDAFVYARKQLQKKADSLEEPVSKLNTTLLVAVGSRDIVGGAAVGDGGIVWHRGGQTGLVIPREDTEYENETIPLQSENWDESYRYGWVADADAAAVFSDGLDSVAWDGPASVSDELFDQVFSSLREYSDLDKLEGFLEEFLDGESLRKSSRDDKTLVVGALPPSEWTDPADVDEQEGPSGEYPEPKPAETTDVDLDSGVPSASAPPQKTGQETRYRSTESITEALGESNTSRITSRVGIVALVLVVVVAAVFVGTILLGSSGDSPGDANEEPAQNGGDENDDSQPTGDNEDEASADLSITDFEVTHSEASRGDQLTASANVSYEGSADQVNVTYFIRNETGSEEKINDTSKMIRQGEDVVEVKLEGAIENSTTALDNETVTQVLEVEAQSTDSDGSNSAEKDLFLSNSIQEAVKYANETDKEKVSVSPGIYNESVTIEADGMTIEAASGEEVIINASETDGPTIRTAANDTTVAGLTLVATGQDVVSHASRGNLTIVDSTLELVGDGSSDPVAVDTQEGGQIDVLDSTVVGESDQSDLRGISIYNSSDGVANGSAVDNVTFKGDLSRGIQLNATERLDNVTITNSTFAKGISEIAVQVGTSDFDQVFGDIEVRYNEFGAVDTALYYAPAEGSSDLIFRWNNLSENSKGFDKLSAVTNSPSGTAMVNATHVWWGNESGPSGSGNGDGATVSESVNYDPYLDVPFQNREVEGQITLDSVDPEEDVSVTVNLSNNGEVVESETITINGDTNATTYSITDTPVNVSSEGSYTVTVNATNYDQNTTDAIDVSTGESVDNQNLTLERKTG